MKKHLVSIVPYEQPLESVRQAVDLSNGLANLAPRARVFIKPNIVFWTRAVPFPKWGVITTTRVVEDMIVMLKERGIDDITIGEGTVTMNPKDTATLAHAFHTLGYGRLKQKYGIKYLNVFERPFKKVNLGDGVEVAFNRDVLETDYVVDLPVLKAHNQTVVSLGIKNLKGLIDIPSRKRCHNMTPGKDLHFWVSKLADRMPPIFTLIDGIFSNEKGPGPDGKLAEPICWWHRPTFYRKFHAKPTGLAFSIRHVTKLISAAVFLISAPFFGDARAVSSSLPEDNWRSICWHCSAGYRCRISPVFVHPTWLAEYRPGCRCSRQRPHVQWSAKIPC